MKPTVALAILLLAGCHSDAIVLDVQLSTGNATLARGESRELTIAVFGGGDRFKSSFYRGPVEVAFDPPVGASVAPATLVIDMQPANSYDRNRSTGTATLTISADSAPGEHELRVTASTQKNSTAEARLVFHVPDR